MKRRKIAIVAVQLECFRLIFPRVSFGINLLVVIVICFVKDFCLHLSERNLPQIGEDFNPLELLSRHLLNSDKDIHQ